MHMINAMFLFNVRLRMVVMGHRRITLQQVVPDEGVVDVKEDVSSSGPVGGGEGEVPLNSIVIDNPFVKEEQDGGTVSSSTTTTGMLQTSLEISICKCQCSEEKFAKRHYNTPLFFCNKE
jgi:hypothetical protein